MGVNKNLKSLAVWMIAGIMLAASLMGCQIDAAATNDSQSVSASKTIKF